MPFVDTLRQWDEAVTLVDKKNLPEALRTFLAIEEPNSKIYFNIGCLYMLNKDFDAAEKAFDGSIRKDEHLAVAFFQRGITFYKKESFEECLGDFTNAHKALRGNQMIDYKALGLRYKLHASEVLHNMALAEAHLGNWKNAQQNLMKALDYKSESKVIDKAYESILKQKLFKLVEFPSSELFRPNKHYVAELEKKDYLGKAKVVASVVPQDKFAGFAPLQPQVKDGPTSTKEPEVLKALEGKPHIVLFEFFPETSDELAVVPGNIVFVLQKGTDNWASVVFNGRKGLVPYNYLQPLNISPTSKIPEGINTPPTKAPPIRPRRNGDQSPVVKSKADKNKKDTEFADNNCIIKIHFTFTFAISMPLGSSYEVLIDKISKKLKLETTPLTLSLTPEATGDSVINADTDMTSVWSRAKDGRLTMWCKINEPTEEPQVCFVALHTYESSNPEDLSFQEGDKIVFLSRINQDWIEGKCGENVGIFPASFVEELPADGQ